VGISPGGTGLCFDWASYSSRGLGDTKKESLELAQKKDKEVFRRSFSSDSTGKKFILA
jgi:hypothetical protein